MNSQYESIKEVNSIFEQPWYLNAIAPGCWKSMEIIRGNEIVARLPIVIGKRFGFRIIKMPQYIQTLGVWFKDNGGKTTHKLEVQKEIINELIEKLPEKINIDITLDHSCFYVLPWEWQGFSIEPCFSYRIEDLSDTEAIWHDMRENIRREIRKAVKKITIRDDMPIDNLMDMERKTFKRQHRNISIDEVCLKRLDEELVAHSSRKLLYAVDADGRINASAYFVYDKECCYYLIGGGDPELRNSGAASLLLWEGIKFASTVSKSFDFEGSMIENIERFFRGFGAYPQVYYRIRKLNPLLSFMNYLKPKMKKLLGYK